MDLVIYDEQFTPFVFNQNGVKYIPAEGIYAVFEVKPEINKAYIEYAGEKIASVRKLHRTATTFINGGRKCAPRGFTKILGGILTISNSFTTEKMCIRDRHTVYHWPEGLKRRLRSLMNCCKRVQGIALYIFYWQNAISLLICLTKLCRLSKNMKS